MTTTAQTDVTKARADLARQSDAPERASDRPLYRPLADIYEADDSVYVVLELPGVEPDSIDVTLEKRVLTVRAQAPETPRAGFQRAHAEYGEGDYERAFTLSDEIDQSGLTADLKHGVLTLRLPKAAAAQPQKVTVRAS